MVISKENFPIILCVEDEQDLCRDIADELREAGYQVLEAASVKQAWNTIQNTRPDLILCDISMPFESGYTLLNNVKQAGANYADIPFVFLTALSDPQEVVKGKRLGADDYLIKPIDYDLLLATVQARLRQVGRIHAGITQTPHLIDERKLAKLYHLTPTEIRVTLALTEGLPISDIASKLNVARTTAAFHLRNIFQKTEVNRQAELVALVMKSCLKH
jgi:DNA-binding NarL/FixJ family response regulator